MTTPSTKLGRGSATRVLITGASSGIGRALALHYGRSGARVALLARSESALREVAAEIESSSGEALVLPCDASDLDALKRNVLEAEARFEGLDIVIANAGRGHSMEADQPDLAQVEQTMRLNYLAAIATLYAALPGMRAQGQGKLVAISSMASARGLAGTAPYTASKAALANHAEALRVELRGSGVRVCSILPGFVRTPMVSDIPGPLPFAQSPERAAKLIARAIRKGRAQYVFPWQMRLLTRLMRVLPAWIFDPISARALKGKDMGPLK